MLPRDRVIKTYNFIIPDRIPLDFCADEPIYDALIKKAGVEDQLELMKYFHIDFRWARPKWIGPKLKTPDGKKLIFLEFQEKVMDGVILPNIHSHMLKQLRML